ncbi:MARVEL domain-containing protein 3 [Trichomycterus rosablanca]|uniref:MARVEL domain-containing protein 3 n=1 Tax=Trichomycterus rosablanca TaxID=2290929 RepID=UPI002F35DFC0
MPERHHNQRYPNHPDCETRDSNRAREYKRSGQNEKYRDERSTVYEENRGRSFREPHNRAFTPTPTYESTFRVEDLYNLRYIPTARGLCQGMEFFINMLIVICAGVPYSNKGQYQDLASLGGLYYYYYGGAQAFAGQELVRVKELDGLFYQLKLPPYIFSMACGGALMVYALAMLALGVFRVPFRLTPVLLIEAVIDGLISLGYIPAVAFYFIKVQETYSNPICTERDALYQSKGYRGMECKLSGTDIAGGFFGVLGFIVFMASAVLAVRAFRAVRQMKQQREPEDNNL